MNALEVVNTYNDNITKRGGENIEALLTDDIVFKGPLQTTNGITEYLKTFAGFLKAKKTYHMQKQFVDGNSVCSIYVMEIETPLKGTIQIPVADWVEVRDGKVAKQTVYDDSRLYSDAFPH